MQTKYWQNKVLQDFLFHFIILLSVNQIKSYHILEKLLFVITSLSMRTNTDKLEYEWNWFYLFIVIKEYGKLSPNTHHVFFVK
jgi:hypothetical protein